MKQSFNQSSNLLQVEENGFDTGFAANPALAADVIWTLPATDGTAGQALVTDGAKNLSFGAAGLAAGDILALVNHFAPQ